VQDRKRLFGALRALGGTFSLSRASGSSAQAKPIFVFFVSFVVNLTYLLVPGAENN
jgi:hypothetical protein